MKRICFCLQVKRDRLAEYRDRHQAVWPEMQEALQQAGWHNYSLFLRDDGLLIGYVETPDFDRALTLVAATEVNRRWQEWMADFLKEFPDGSERANAGDPRGLPLERIRYAYGSIS